MDKKRWLILGCLTGLVGGFYEFVPRKVIKSISELLLFDIVVLGHRIRHNDLILLATMLLIISFVCFYKAYRMSREENESRKEQVQAKEQEAPLSAAADEQAEPATLEAMPQAALVKEDTKVEMVDLTLNSKKARRGQNRKKTQKRPSKTKQQKATSGRRRRK